MTPYRVERNLAGEQSTTELPSELFFNGQRVNQTRDGFQVVNTGELLTRANS